LKTIKRKDEFPEWAKYVAKNEDGEKWFFSNEPLLREIAGFLYWRCKSTADKTAFHKYGKPTTEPWKKIWKIVD